MVQSWRHIESVAKKTHKYVQQQFCTSWFTSNANTQCKYRKKCVVRWKVGLLGGERGCSPSAFRFNHNRCQIPSDLVRGSYKKSVRRCADRRKILSNHRLGRSLFVCLNRQNSQKLRRRRQRMILMVTVLKMETMATDYSVFWLAGRCGSVTGQ